MPWLIPAAIVAAAGIGAGASALSSSSAAKASKRGTDASIAANDRALEAQQANSAPYRAAGGLALNAITDRFGLTSAAPTGGAGNAGQPGAGSPNLAGQPDWNAYLAADPGIMQEFQKQSPGRLAALGVSTPQEFAQWHYNTVGQYDGHTLPTYAAPEQSPAPAEATPAQAADPGAPAPPAPTQGAASVDNQGYYTAPRPTVAAAPVYQPPAYRETPVAPLDVGLDKYQQAPDYQFQLDQGNKNILANKSATGGLESGAALKALQKFGQDLALGDYAQWRDYTTGQYNNDRSYTANRDDASNAYNLTNAGRAFDSANSTYQYGTNLGQSIFNSDRDYNTGRYDTQTNALFNLASLGAGQATNYSSALGQNAAANSNAYFSNATNAGNAALATGGAINNAASNAGNALAYYYGNSGGSAGLPKTTTI